MKLTPQQKIDKKARDNLKLIHNNILASFSFGGMKTWTDVWKHLGLGKIDDKPVTYTELKTYLTNEMSELERKQNETSLVSEAINQVTNIEPEPINNKSNSIPTIPNVRATFTNEGIQLPTIQAEEKIVLEMENDYGFTPSPNESFFPFWHQKKAITEIKQKLITENKSCVLLLAGTGTGKTFNTYGVIRRMMDTDFHEGKTWSHIPYLVLTKSTIVEQHKRVARKQFNLNADNVEITNIETLRSNAGQLWIKEKMKIVKGEEVHYYEWKEPMAPALLAIDESQGAKNQKAKQSRAIYAYNNLPGDKHKLLLVSATPFMRVIEAKAFAVGTHRDISHLGFPEGTKLTNDNWPIYASVIASPARPDDYNESAVERLMKDLEPWVVRVRGVHPQFDAENGVKIIQFQTLEQRKFYEDAEQRYLEEKAKLDRLKDAGEKISQICYLVIRMKYAMAAELCHAEHWAEEMYHDVMEGFAAVTAPKYKGTIIRIVELLTSKYGVSRDKISLIWGGGQTQLTKKQKIKQKIKAKADALKEMGIDIGELLEDTGLDEVEDRMMKDLPEHLRLGSQDQDERQREIDKFQRGDSLYCLYTLKAGGVGLSLHHTDEYTDKWNEQAPGYTKWREEIDNWNLKQEPTKRVKPGKCRRKKSGYVFVEDIPFIPTRPRTTRITVSDNAIELAQGVGRVPRLTSLSKTRQYVSCYAGTVEVDMGRIYTKKFNCLSAIVRQKESWLDIRFGVPAKRYELVEESLNKNGQPNDESGLIDIDEVDDEEENSEQELSE